MHYFRQASVLLHNFHNHEILPYWVEPDIRNSEAWDDVFHPWESVGVFLPALVEPGVLPPGIVLVLILTCCIRGFKTCK